MYYVSKSYNCHKIFIRGHSQVEKPCKIVIIIRVLSPEIRYVTSPILWKPLHQACMDNIKALVCKTPILRPVDPSSDEPIWVICNASASGMGAVYGQGQTWQTCRPAGFMSEKFTGAQMNYCVFKMETIAILEALLKWEDKLIGNRLNVVTNHRALEFFKTQ